MPESLFPRLALIGTLLVPLTSAAVAAVVGSIGDGLAPDADRSRKLHASYQATCERREQKERHVDDLLAGRATLRETVVRFLVIHHGDQAHWATIRKMCPEQSDEAWAARNVLRYVENRLGQRPECAMVREQLGCELVSFLAEIE